METFFELTRELLMVVAAGILLVTCECRTGGPVAGPATRMDQRWMSEHGMGDRRIVAFVGPTAASMIKDTPGRE